MTDWLQYLGQKRLLDRAEIQRGAEEMVEIAKQQDVDVVLVGGAALIYFGSPRLTSDVDFAATGIVPAQERGDLSFGGKKLTSPSGVPVDWILRNDDYAALYEEAIEHPQHGGPSPVPIAQPEYLLAMKMAADRLKDQADVEWMLATEGVVNLKKARGIVKRHLGTYSARSLDNLVIEIAWKKERGIL